jgi:predicted MFS family arabinose efflux permease
VPRSALASAVALNSAIWSGTRVVATAGAALIIARFNPAAAFYLAALGFAVMAVAVYGLNSLPRNPVAQASPLKDMLEGLSFIRRSSVFSFLVAMTFFNSFFGISYFYLMPIFALDILEVGTEGQGWLLSVGGIGALLTTVWLGSRKEVSRKGLLVIGGGIAFGLSLAAFGLTSRFFPSYVLALGLMFVMGVTSAAYMISITSSLQLLVPDRMRGRVMGFFGMTWNILPLGGMQVGILASLITAPYAVAVGGLAVAAFASGSAALSRQVRSMGFLLHQAETGVESPATESSPSLPSS